MTDKEQTPTEMLEELTVLRARIAELEHSASEKQHTEMVPLENALRFKLLADHLPDLVYILKPGIPGTAYCNKTSFLGYTWEQLTGPISISQSIYHEDIPAVTARWQQLLSNEERNSEGLLYRVKNAQGALEWLRQRDSIVALDAQGKPAEILVTLSLETARKRAEDELISHRDYLEELVAERTAELTNAHTQLVALSTVKDEFVGSISHELRTPITVLKLVHRLLAVRPEKSDQYLAMLDREIIRLESIIEDMLAVASLHREEEAFTFVPVNLYRLAEQLADDRRPLAEERGLTLTLSGSRDLPLVHGDERLLERVVSILLTNSLNYTPTGGWITINSQLTMLDGKQWIRLSISDNGPGIPVDEQPHLFERFFRGRISLETHTPGSGLGLAIAREIVVRHRGFIDYEPGTNSGGGSTFNVWLPPG